MRIAHVSDCYLPRLGGIERQVHDLAARQHHAGHDVEIITSVSAGTSVDELVVHRPATTRHDDRIQYQTSRSAAALVAGRRYDVVHLHVSTWSPLAYWAASAALQHGVPTAATVHSLWSTATPALRIAGSLLGWRSWPVAWSAVSTAAASSVARVITEPIAVLPNGIDADWWHLPDNQQTPGRLRIVSVMRLARRKRPRQLLRMLAGLRHSTPDSVALSAVLIGDGPLDATLRADVKRLGLGDWVELTGRLDRTRIRDRFRNADVYVAPARLESFGIAALEARAAGLPVLAFAHTGVADFVTGNEDGILVDTDEQMRDVLIRAACDSRQLRSIAIHNRSRPPVVTWSSVLRKCDRLYDHARHLIGAGANSVDSTRLL